MSHQADCVSGLLALSLAVVALSGSSAHAGTWMRSSCINPDRSAAPSEGWSSFSGGAVSYGSSSSVACGVDTPMHALLSAAAPAAVGAHVTLAYSPPSGSTLSGGVVAVDLLADGAGYNASGIAAVYTPAHAYDSNVVIQCAWGLAACANGTHHYVGEVPLPPARGGALYVGASCGGLAGFACNAGGSAGAWSRVHVYYANLVLRSDYAPTASNFRGSLLAPAAHGTAGLAFDAAVGGGPGIHKVAVTIDGKTFADTTPNTNAGRCAAVGVSSAGELVFPYQQPCPLTATVDLAIRTTTLRDGPHALKVVVTDAARNAQTVLRETITTLNRTTASSTLTSSPPAAAPGPVAGIGMGVGVGSDPGYALALDAPTQALSRGVRSVWARSAITLSGIVRTTAGAPAAGVAVTLLAHSRGEPAPRVVARTVSDAGGRWTLRAPRGPTRTLTVSAGTLPDPQSARAIKIRQTVRPRISLRVRALGQGRLRFTGRLRFEPLGSPRPLVVIQTLNARKRWQDVGTALRVTRTGRYAVTYDGGPNVIGGSYAFRTVSHGTALLATGTSPIRRALVR